MEPTDASGAAEIEMTPLLPSASTTGAAVTPAGSPSTATVTSPLNPPTRLTSHQTFVARTFQRLHRAARAVGDVELFGLDQVVQLHHVDVVDVHSFQ